MNVENETVLRFSTIDYIIFVCLLGFSALIGIYYGFIAKRKQDNTAEYILGSRSMSLFPIAVSLIVSWVKTNKRPSGFVSRTCNGNSIICFVVRNISGMTILGYPVDIYLYGTQIFVPVFTSNIAVSQNEDS